MSDYRFNNIVIADVSARGFPRLNTLSRSPSLQLVYFSFSRLALALPSIFATSANRGIASFFSCNSFPRLFITDTARHANMLPFRIEFARYCSQFSSFSSDTSPSFSFHFVPSPSFCHRAATPIRLPLISISNFTPSMSIILPRLLPSIICRHGE